MILDKLGQEIKPGVWIAYGHKLGQCAGLRLGKVLKVGEGDTYEQHPWLNTDRITVWGIDDDHIDYSKHNPNDSWSKPRALANKSTLLFHNRCLVVPDDKVPEEYIKLVEEAMLGMER
jgi:hypothetical protein